MAMERSPRCSNISSSAAADTYAYIGSQISLVSKSEIRYQGILSNLNTQESTIALSDVRSFGTEGRKKDGPEIPPSDKIYEYILFRGSDIKDMQVKSSPPIQSTTSVYNDPAIIQLGLPKSSPENNEPIYHPGGSLGSWGSSYPYPTTDGILPAPVYIKGIQGASEGFQTQQQSLFQPPSGLLALPSLHQTMPYPSMTASTPNRSSNIPASPLLDNPLPLLASFSPVAPDLHSSFPLQSSALPTDLSTLLKPSKGPMQGLDSADMTTASLQLVTPPITTLDEGAFSTGGTVLPKSADPAMSFKGLQSEQHVACAPESFLNRGLIPPLVTPDQFLQPVTAVGSSYQSSQTVQKDVEMVRVALAEPLQRLLGAQAPILPLPMSLDYKILGDLLHSHHSTRGGSERGRGRWASPDVTDFTEDFDIVSMNEKFKKDEVWGQLGKTNSTQEEGYFWDKDNVDHVAKTTSETMPVFVKDDFFNSLSSNSPGRSHRGRSIFSEKKKSNTEKVGTLARHRGGHYGRGYGHSGYGLARGLSGDGYGHNRVGRGFGYGGPSRNGRNSGRSYEYNKRGGCGFGRSYAT